MKLVNALKIIIANIAVAYTKGEKNEIWQRVGGCLTSRLNSIKPSLCKRMEYSDAELNKMSKTKLGEICEELGIKGYKSKTISQRIELIKKHQNDASSVDSDEFCVSADSDASSVDSDASMDDREYVITPCKAPEEYNRNTMKEHLTTYMTPRLEFYKDTDRALFYEDDFAEYHSAKSTNGTRIGAGNHPMDVTTSANNGIDVFCVTTKTNNNSTNEKSLIQNFKDAGTDLDNLFQKKKDTKIVELFGKAYLTKLAKVQNIYGNLYYHGFISTKTDIYEVWFKITLDHIKNVSSDGFITGSDDNVVNVKVKGFINCKYGNVKAYKSKRRLELRLNLKALIKDGHAKKIYTMPSSA